MLLYHNNFGLDSGSRKYPMAGTAAARSSGDGSNPGFPANA